MIIKHSTDETPRQTQIGLRIARVVSIGKGTVDVCPVGSSVVLHDIPVTSATTMVAGDIINLQIIDNRRFAFASQNADASSSIVTNNVTIQNGDINIAGEGGSGLGTITGVSGGLGLTGSGNSGTVVLNVGGGDGISVDSDSVSVKVLSNGGISVGANGVYLASSLAGDGLNITSGVLDVDSTVVRTTRTISAGNGLTGGGSLAANRSFAVQPATGGSAIGVDATGVFLNSSLAGDGLSMTSQVLNVNAGNGISVDDSSVAVNQAYGFAWTSAHAFNSGFTAAASTFSSTLGVSGATTLAGLSATTGTFSSTVSGTSGTFTTGLNVGSETGATTGQIKATQGTFSGNVNAVNGTFTGGFNVGIATGAGTGQIKTSGYLGVNGAGVTGAAIEAWGATQTLPAATGTAAEASFRASGSGNNSILDIGTSETSAWLQARNRTNYATDYSILINPNGGNVGINTQIPSYTLDVSGDIRASGAINIGTATGTASGYLYTSGRIGVGKNAADYPLDVAGDIFSSASVRASTSVITQELTGAGATTSVSLTNGTGFKSSQYQSGFAGNGWRIYRQEDTAKSEWEVDNLTVRGTLSVYELLIQQIRATNGSIFVSAAAKIESVTGTGPYTLTVEGGSSDHAPFAVNDILRAQRVSLGTSTLVWQSDLTVTGINSVVNGTANSRAFTATLRSGSTVPAEGMEYVRLGNTTNTNRQGSVYLTADDSGAPFIDIVNDITSHADWNTAGKVKARIGRLNGIVGGATDNYGIWSGTGTNNTDSWVKMAEDGILLNNVPLKMYSGSDQTVDFAANGNLKIGTNVDNASTTALSWNGTTLTVKGDITVTGGNAETTSGAQSKATTAQTTAINTASSDATTKANSAQTTAISTAASDATSKSNTAQSNAQSYSDTELGKVVNKATGKLAFSFATAPTGTGLYLGSSHLGYYNGGWKTYMDSSGNFYLNGTSGTQGLTWTTSTNTLAIDGAITAQSGNIAGVLTIGASGAIRQGTGTWASTFTGLNIDQENSRGRIRFFDNNSVRGVFGNLASTYDYSATALYGLAIGSYTGSWISADPTYGFRVMNSTTERFQVDSTGNVSIGNPSGTTSYITIDTTNGIRAIDGGTTQFQVDNSGNVTIGPSAGNNVYITGSGLNIRRGSTNALSLTSTSMTINNSSGNAVISLDNSGNASVAGVLNVGTSGGIYQGSSGTFASPGTGLKIWNSGGAGLIAGYNSTVVQWQAGTDGKLYAGGGNIELSSAGIKLKSAVSAVSYSAGLNFANSVDGSSLASLGYDSNDDALKVYLNGSTSTFLVESFYAVGGSNSSIVVKGGSPFIAWVGKDSLTNTKTWDAGVSTNYWYLRALNDAGSLYSEILRAGRTTGTNTVSTFDINSTAISLNGSVTSSSTYLTLVKDTEITKSSPFLRFWSTDSFANNRRWDIGVTAYTLLFRLYNDANTSSAIWFTATRSANTISSISIASSSTSFSGDVSANDGVFTGGLNVGTATGAGTGAIKASAGLIATTGAFSSTLSATSTISTGGGLNVGMLTLGAGNGDIAYTGDLTASRTSSYTGYIYVPNTAYTNLTDTGSTAWSGSATRAVGNYQINLTANGNGFNAAIKAVVLAVRGSWTTASASNRLNIREWVVGGTGGTNQIIVTAQAANIPIDNVGVVNVGSNSSITVEVAGASVSNGLIRVIGYYI